MVNKDAFLENYRQLDNSVIIEIIDIYLNEYQERMEKMTTAAKNRDFQGLRFFTHDIKGLVASFYAQGLLQQVKNFEVTAIRFQESNGEGFEEAPVIKEIDAIKVSLHQLAAALLKIKAELK